MKEEKLRGNQYLESKNYARIVFETDNFAHLVFQTSKTVFLFLRFCYCHTV